MIRLAIHSRPILLLTAALALGACKREQPAPAPVLTIENHAANQPPESAERIERPIALDTGETATLAYTIIKPATDPASAAVQPDDTVTIRFAAGLDRGPAGIEIYDSTIRRNRDFSFSLADPGVIRGLREAIPGMRPGELQRIEIPWRLAYGENGRGEIPPSTDLVFAVELVSID